HQHHDRSDPINAATNNWTIAPEAFEAARQQWEYSHAANAVPTFVAFVAIIHSVLRHKGLKRDDACSRAMSAFGGKAGRGCRSPPQVSDPPAVNALWATTRGLPQPTSSRLPAHVVGVRHA